MAESKREIKEQEDLSDLDDLEDERQDSPLNLDDSEVKDDEVASYDFVANPDLYMIAEGVRFGVERAKILKHSKVLEASLDGDKDEKEYTFDVKPDILRQILQIIYTPRWCKVKVSDDKYYLEMVPFAFQYDMKKVLKLCEKGIIGSFDYDCKLLAFIDKYKLESVKKDYFRREGDRLTKLTPEEIKELKECSGEMLIEFIQAEKCHRIERELGMVALLEELKGLGSPIRVGTVKEIVSRYEKQ